MGLIFRKRVKVGDNTAVNVSRSGASVSRRVGRVTVNSRGGGRVRILPGLSFRFGRRR
ncbi:MAG TPA: DUF4236 domain-containing protein [Jatrophihabitantaceae bacterium]|jgi:hypothetical protein